MDNFAAKQEPDFCKKSDFILTNSSLAEISSLEALNLIREEYRLFANSSTSANASKRNNINSNVISLLHRLVCKNAGALMDYHQFVSKICGDHKAFFFRRLSEKAENKILQQVDDLHTYLNCFTEENQSIAEKILNFKNIDLLYSYMLFYQAKNSGSKFLNTFDEKYDFFLNFDESIIGNNISRFSNMLNRRIKKYEPVLYKDNQELNLLEYGKKWSTILSYDHLDNAVKSILANKHKYDDQAIKLLQEYNRALTSHGFTSKRLESLETLFKEKLKTIQDDNISNYAFDKLVFHLYEYTYLSCNTLEKQLDLSNAFVDGINLIADYIDKVPEISSKDNCVKNLYQVYSNFHRFTQIPNLPRIKNEEVESYFLFHSLYLNSSFVFSYVKGHKIFGEKSIEDALIKYKNADLIIQYAKLKNSRFFEAEKEIAIHGSVLELIDYSDTFNVIYENHDIVFHKMLKFISDKPLAYMNKYIQNNVVLPKLNSKNESSIKKNTELSFAYVAATKERFVKFENVIYNKFKEMFYSENVINLTHLFKFCKNMCNYKKYCTLLGNEVFVRKIEQCLFTMKIEDEPELVQSFPTILNKHNVAITATEAISEFKSELIDYVINYVKMPSKLFDNSIIGKEAEYLKFKEDYVKERTANRKRQRRKNIGDDTQGQGQSGSGYETSLGESTIVLE